MSGSYTDPFAQASQSLGYGQPNTPLPTAQMPLPQSTGGLPSDQPGMFGVAPSTWQNIAAMGAGMIQGANARTADGHLANGTGIAGGLAGAAQGLIGNQMAQARARSEYGLQGEQMQGLHLQNQINQAMLPYQLRRAQLSNALMDPNVAAQYWRQMDAASGMPGGGGSAPIDFGNGDYASAIGSMEGGAGQNPRSTANGYGQLIHDQKIAFAKANPQYFQGATSLDGPFQNPDVGKAATNWMAQQNAPVLSSAGVPVSGPTLAMAHRLGPAPAAAVFKAPDQTPLPVALAQALPPDKVADYVRANPDFAKQTVGQFKQQFAGVPNYGPAQNVQYQPGQGGAQPGSAPGQGGAGGFASPGVSVQAQQRAADLTAQAGRLEQRQAQAKMLGIPGPPGDAAAMRAQASEYLKLGLAGPQAAQSAQGAADVERDMKPGTAAATSQAEKNVALAMDPQIEKAKAFAKLQADPLSDRNGNWIIAGNKPGSFINLGKSPQIGTVWNEQTGNLEHGDMGATGMFAGQPGVQQDASTIQTNPTPANAVAGPGPGKKQFIEGLPEVTRTFIDHDNKVVNEDLAHVIDNVTPAKQQLFQLRTLNPDANPGAAGEFRMDFKNWVQTFAPDFVSKITGDASPMQEFKKIALMGAGKQERGDLGARGGFRAMELYMSANPNLDNQPTANHDMANALLVSHQYHEDYARGASGFYNGQLDSMQKGGSTKGYQPISKYDPEFAKTMRPELYAKAIEAMNGKPYASWSKGLSVPQMRIVGGILQRTDPSATVDLGGKQVPVSKFTSTFGPEDVRPSGGSGGN